MGQFTRREFLKSSAGAAAALSLPAWSWARVPGANGDIRVAVVGFHGRGKSHIQAFRQMPGVRVVALCDVDRKVLSQQVEEFKKRNEAVEAYADVRQLLDNKDIDAISIATPNHWHALMAIWACQAGKDVYVEKPVSHNVWEGRKIVEAARKYGRIVQAGTQCRSNPGMRQAMEYIHSGQLGKIKLVRGLCYKRRASIGKVEGDQPIPEELNYDLWTGPAPLTPLRRKRLHYDWHWVWPTGNGDLGNQGIHQMDLCRWALQAEELSPWVMSIGGRFGYEDDGETPNTLIIFHDYDVAPLIFEVRGLPAHKETGPASSAPAKSSSKRTGAKKGASSKPASAPSASKKKGQKKAASEEGAQEEGEEAEDTRMDSYRGARIGVVVDCEHGSLVLRSYTGGVVYDNEGKEVAQFKEAANHHANFIAAVRSRKASDLNADILGGHLSSALCHTGNISYRVGAPASPQAIREAIQGEPQARETFGRFQEHLAANGVDLSKTKAALGVWLKVNSKAERFVGAPAAATALLRRDYRKPFVVPEKV